MWSEVVGGCAVGGWLVSYLLCLWYHKFPLFRQLFFWSSVNIFRVNRMKQEEYFS